MTERLLNLACLVAAVAAPAWFANTFLLAIAGQ